MFKKLYFYCFLFFIIAAVNSKKLSSKFHFNKNVESINFDNVEHPLENHHLFSKEPSDYLINNLPGLPNDYNVNMYSGQVPVYENQLKNNGTLFFGYLKVQIILVKILSYFGLMVGLVVQVPLMDFLLN